jgi:hypothetical protein
MRNNMSSGGFRVRAIAGTHTVLIALDCRTDLRQGLLGFAFKRETALAAGPQNESNCLQCRKLRDVTLPAHAGCRVSSAEPGLTLPACARRPSCR